jgi:intracellular multiplication protein IcmB
MRLAVEGAFRELEKSPRLFSEDRVGSKLYNLVRERGFELKAESCVWEVVDFLFSEGLEHEAILCQREAVPTISDVAAQIRSNPGIKATYDFRLAQTGEEVRDYAWRVLTEAARDYPILASATRFSLGDARVVALDLDEVAPRGGGAAGDRQTAVMYMLARYLAGSRFFLMPQDALGLEEPYRTYHLDRIEEIRLAPKRLCYDELHRVTGESAIQGQLINDLETTARESRKWNLSIGLYSQNLGDFPEVILELATTVFLLGTGTRAQQEKLRKLYGLSSELSSALENLGKPGPDGARFVSIMKTDMGTVKQVLSNTLSPALLWAFSSTTEDCAVRNALYDVFGARRTLELLSLIYPSGLKSEVERRLLCPEGRGKGMGTRDAVQGIIAELIAEMRAQGKK